MSQLETVQVVASILRFLNEEVSSGRLSSEAVESIEVARQCLEAAYAIDPQNPSTNNARDLRQLVFPLSTSEAATASSAVKQNSVEPTAEEREQADVFKNRGNDLMRAQQFDEAIQCYSEAVKLWSSNPIYYCNRAAAYTKLSKTKEAVNDCEIALSIDPNYSKAYGRLGLAFIVEKKYQEAINNYQKALELDPENVSFQQNLKEAKESLRTSQGAPAPGAPAFDLNSMLNNPSIINMASQMMSNPEMQHFMSNIFAGSNVSPPAQNPGPPSTTAETGTGTATSTGSTESQAPTEIPPQSTPAGAGFGLPPGAGVGLPPGMDFSALLQMGQQFAQQMQETNPNLVDQLRNQYQNQNSNPEDQNNSDDPPDYFS